MLMLVLVAHRLIGRERGREVGWKKGNIDNIFAACRLAGGVCIYVIARQSILVGMIRFATFKHGLGLEQKVTALVTGHRYLAATVLL